MAGKKTTTTKQTKVAKSNSKVTQNKPTELMQPENKAKLPKELQEKMDKMKSKMDSFQKKILAKFDNYIMGFGLLPPEKDEKGVVDKEKVNLLVLVDDTDSKKMSKEELKDKLGAIIATIAKETDKNFTTHTVILSEVWQSCYDQKSELVNMFAQVAPIYDKGMLGAIKIGEVHKRMVLKKFEKYIVSYVIFGAFTKGRITPESDIDVAVIVDDTDVKKMTRAELKDKLRAIIISMGFDAKQITGVSREFHIQVYILTDFWDSLKEAHPVIFDLLRDGVPLYDRGIFMPWKQLLLMGKIKPSEEAIDMFMNSGEQIQKRVKYKLRDIAMEDIFLSILTPSQAALMTYGLPPPAPKETPKILEDVFVKKEKILEQKYVDIIAEVIKVRKDIEHGKLKEVSGSKIDELLGNAEDYLKRIQKLFKQLEEKRDKKDINHIYERAITAIRDCLVMEGVNDAPTEDIQKLFKKVLVDTGKLPEDMLRSIKQIFKGKKDFDSGKLTKNEIIKTKKHSRNFIKAVVEFMQRKRGKEIERSKLRIKYGDKFGEILLLDKTAYIIPDLDSEDKELQKAKIKEDGSLGKIESCNFEVLEDALAKKNLFEKVLIKQKIFSSLEKIFGEDMEILIN